MILQIPDLLNPGELTQLQGALASAPWEDGKQTAGYQSSRVKHNQQLPEQSALSRQLGEVVLNALQRSFLFHSAALADQVFPPLFNRYEAGHTFGTHVDNAIRPVAGTSSRIRTDLSATLFLSDPASYDGGELVIEDTYGAQSVKLPAGHLILYPATSLHRVTPVRRGVRQASFFWVQSMVKDDGERSLLFDMDMNIQRLRQELGDDHGALIALTGCYNNLLRRWAVL
jgi:PKHD-type hydroxylase